jgi:hypothetical protein
MTQDMTSAIENLIDEPFRPKVACNFLKRQVKMNSSLVVPVTVNTIVDQSNKTGGNNGASRAS